MPSSKKPLLGPPIAVPSHIPILGEKPAEEPQPFPMAVISMPNGEKVQVPLVAVAIFSLGAVEQIKEAVREVLKEGTTGAIEAEYKEILSGDKG